MGVITARRRAPRSAHPRNRSHYMIWFRGSETGICFGPTDIVRVRSSLVRSCLENRIKTMPRDERWTTQPLRPSHSALASCPARKRCAGYWRTNSQPWPGTRLPLRCSLANRGLSMPTGELFNLERLVEECKEPGRRASLYQQHAVEYE
jgi:hypothetical protein